MSGCSPKAPPPAAAPGYFPKELASPGAEMFDAAALQVESFITDFADRLQQRAATDAASAFAEDFQGSVPLTPPATPPTTRNLAGGLIEIAVNDGVETAGASPPAAVFAAFLKGAPAIYSARMKMTEMEFWDKGVFGKLKFELNGVSTGAKPGFSIQEKFDAVLVLREGEWRFLKLRRTERREVRSSQPFVSDVTAAAGLTVPREPGLGELASPFDGLRGCAAADLDGDGWLDLVLVSPFAIHVFRNEKGARFTEVTKDCGIKFTSPCSAVLAWDYDGDGRLDLVISQCVWKDSPLGQPDPRAIVLWHNEGEMKFSDATAASGIESNGPATGLAAADVDGDGRLDLYVCMYGMHTPESFPHLPLRARNGAANQLWMNRGGGRFVEAAAKAGVADTGFSLAAAFGDLDGDGRPDLYLANDFGAHRLYRNRGDGTFEERVADQGFGMGVSWGDYNNDGALDLYVSNMYSNAGKRLLRSEEKGLQRDVLERARKSAEGNTLLRNDGGKLTDVTAAAGVGPGGWAWSNAFIDLDNDGRQDLYVVNGYLSGLSKRDR
jgi:hypothetical protein